MLHFFKDRKVDAIIEGVSSNIAFLGLSMQAVENTKDPLERFVNYFRTLEKFSDHQGTGQKIRDAVAEIEQLNKSGRYDGKLGALRTLDTYVHLATRGDRKEPATEDSMKLGGIHGLFTLPVSHWREAFNREGNPFADSDKKVIERQAAAIVDPCVPKIKESIATLTGGRK